MAAQDPKPARPEDNLPSNITQLTAFGERASWSPDGRQIAFMSKSFGDAFVVDVRTKVIRLLTHYPHAGYLRVQYLPNGDLFLIGARTFTDIRSTRSRDQEMWVLKAGSRGPVLPLEHKISEGVAMPPYMKYAMATMMARKGPTRTMPSIFCLSVKRSSTRISVLAVQTVAAQAYSENSSTSRIPGMTPDRKSRPIEVSVAIP